MKEFMKSIKKKKLSSIIALVIIIGISIPFTLSFLTDRTPAVENTFTAGKVDTEIVEDFNKKIKNDVKFTNKGHTPVYIRAAVVVNWKDAKGNYIPANESDYDLIINRNKNNWKEINGFHYFKFPVKPEKSTDILVNKAEPLVNKEDYKLSIEILSSSIQSEPDEAVIEAWGQEVFDLLGGGE